MRTLCYSMPHAIAVRRGFSSMLQGHMYSLCLGYMQRNLEIMTIGSATAHNPPVGTLSLARPSPRARGPPSSLPVEARHSSSERPLCENERGPPTPLCVVEDASDSPVSLQNGISWPVVASDGFRERTTRGRVYVMYASAIIIALY